MYWTDQKIRKTTSLSTKTENQRLHWRKSMNHTRHQNQNTEVFKCVNEPELAKSALFSKKEKPYGRDWFRARLKINFLVQSNVTGNVYMLLLHTCRTHCSLLYISYPKLPHMHFGRLATR